MHAGHVLVHRFGPFKLFAASLARASPRLVDVEAVGDERLFARKSFPAQGAQMLDALVNRGDVRFHRVLRLVNFPAVFKVAGETAALVIASYVNVQLSLYPVFLPALTAFELLLPVNPLDVRVETAAVLQHFLTMRALEEFPTGVITILTTAA